MSPGSISHPADGLLSEFGAITSVGDFNVNTNGSSFETNIGTGGTGAVSIGNSTGGIVFNGPITTGGGPIVIGGGGEVSIDSGTTGDNLNLNSPSSGVVNGDVNIGSDLNGGSFTGSINIGSDLNGGSFTGSINIGNSLSASANITGSPVNINSPFTGVTISSDINIGTDVNNGVYDGNIIIGSSSQTPNKTTFPGDVFFAEEEVEIINSYLKGLTKKGEDSFTEKLQKLKEINKEIENNELKKLIEEIKNEKLKKLNNKELIEKLKEKELIDGFIEYIEDIVNSEAKLKKQQKAREAEKLANEQKEQSENQEKLEILTEEMKNKKAFFHVKINNKSSAGMKLFFEEIKQSWLPEELKTIKNNDESQSTETRKYFYPNKLNNSSLNHLFEIIFNDFKIHKNDDERGYNFEPRESSGDSDKYLILNVIKSNENVYTISEEEEKEQRIKEAIERKEQEISKDIKEKKRLEKIETDCAASFEERELRKKIKELKVLLDYAKRASGKAQSLEGEDGFIQRFEKYKELKEKIKEDIKKKIKDNDLLLKLSSEVEELVKEEKYVEYGIIRKKIKQLL